MLSYLVTAGSNHSIDPSLLAAIGVRESGFRNVSEVDGAGVGVGIFQITVNESSGVTIAQASSLPSAADYAAGLLASNRAYLSSDQKFYRFDATHLSQAIAASYNINPYLHISGNPDTIDIGTTDHNYGSNILSLMNCFP